MNGRDSVTGNVSGHLAPFDRIKEQRRIPSPGDSREKNIQNDVDVDQDLHLEYFFSR